MKRKWPIIAACIVWAGLSACSSEPRSVTLHSPGVYKGDPDELIAKSQQQQQVLNDRLRLVQTDR
jgi:hypothetical protein